jgi:hypothetical protein
MAIRVVLYAAEPFFLSGGNDFCVAHQACRAVVVEDGQSQDVHEQGLIREKHFRACVPRRFH